MKIAMFLNTFPEISETFILNQICGLIDRGHCVDIYAKRPGASDRVHAEVGRYGLTGRTRYLGNIPRNYLARIGKAIALLADNFRYLDPSVLLGALNFRKYGRAASSLGLLYEAVPLLRERRYDILHCQFGNLGPMAVQLKAIGALTGRLVTSFRGYDVTQYLRKRPGAYDGLFREGDLFLPVSSSLARLLEGAGCPPERIRVHHSGINCSLLQPGRRTWREGEPVRVITVARLIEKKGIAFAIRAVAEVLATGRRVAYTIVGDGALRSDLERLIGELGIRNEVTLAGPQVHDDVIRLMRESHVLMAPSITAADGDQEGIPNVVKEAMALGLPVIATMHSGIPELVRDGITGYLVPERDHAALAERLAGLVDHHEKWQEFGNAGRTVVEDGFDRDKLNDSLVGLYRGLLSGGEQRAG